MAGSLGLQAERVGPTSQTQTSFKKVTAALRPPSLRVLTGGCMGHSVGKWRRHAALVGLKSTLERQPITSQNPSCTHAISLTVSVSHFS